jgi:hypothetical protein
MAQEKMKFRIFSMPWSYLTKESEPRIPLGLTQKQEACEKILKQPFA